MKEDLVPHVCMVSCSEVHGQVQDSSASSNSQKWGKKTGITPTNEVS